MLSDFTFSLSFFEHHTFVFKKKYTIQHKYIEKIEYFHFHLYIKKYTTLKDIKPQQNTIHYGGTIIYTHFAL